MPDRNPGPAERTEEKARVPSENEVRPRGEGCGRVKATGTMKPLRKGPMSADDEEKKPAYRAQLPLKKGAGRMEVRDAGAWVRDLRDLLERHPDLFHSLRALAEGRSSEVDEQHVRTLRSWGLLGRDLSPHPKLKAVMKAAIRDLPDGPAVVYPLDLTNPEDAATAIRAKREIAIVSREAEKAIRRDINGLTDEKDGGIGR
jgi:hypothetical protein